MEYSDLTRVFVIESTPGTRSPEDAHMDTVDIGAWLTTWLEAITPAIQAFYSAVYQKYLEAGAPYGESDDGMIRWIHEVAKAEQLRHEADMIFERQRMLVDLRRKIAQRN